MTLGNSDSRKKKGEGAEERGGKWGAGEEGEEEAKGKKKKREEKGAQRQKRGIAVGPGCLLRRDWGNVQVAQGGAGSVSGVRPPGPPVDGGLSGAGKELGETETNGRHTRSAPHVSHLPKKSQSREVYRPGAVATGRPDTKEAVLVTLHLGPISGG